MKKLVSIVIIFVVLLPLLFAQEPTWIYTPHWNIQFSSSDRFNNPFECATDSAGNLWVISSTSTSVDAINALYMAAPGDSIFTLVDDYSDESDMHSTRGITTIGNDIYVMCRSVQTYISFMYRYPDGDPEQRTLHNQVGYGTYVYGIDASKDNYIFGGIIYQGPKIRVYDYSEDADPFGHYVAPDCINRDPGGPSATGEDAIRDVALVPDGDYFNTETPVYTSRNSLQDGNTGGVTKWTGGTQDNPENYSGVSLEDADSFLRWTRYVPNGLTVDQDGRLWAVGTDSTRRWVKVFQVDGSWASQVNELPSSTSGDIADPNGAPFNVPEDVALSPDGNVAYVIDVGDHICYTFVNSAVAIEDENVEIVSEFRIDSVFPNPFNPATKISFTLPGKSTIHLRVYDLKGNQLRNIEREYSKAGHYRLGLEMSDCKSGIYLYTIESNFGIVSDKITLLK